MLGLQSVLPAFWVPYQSSRLRPLIYIFLIRKQLLTCTTRSGLSQRLKVLHKLGWYWGFRRPGICHCVTAWVPPDVSKECTALFFILWSRGLLTLGWRHYIPLKHHAPVTQQHSVTFQKAWILRKDIRTSNVGAVFHFRFCNFENMHHLLIFCSLISLNTVKYWKSDYL